MLLPVSVYLIILFGLIAVPLSLLPHFYFAVWCIRCPCPCLPMLGCGSFVRGRKRKKGLLKTFYINEEITRGDYMMSELHTGELGEASQYISIKYSVPLSYIYQTPSTKLQSSIEDPVQHRGPSTPNSPPARYEMLSQKLFMNCQVKRR